MSEQKRLWPAVFIAAIALSHLCFSPASHSTADPCLQTPSSRLVQEVGDAYFAWIKEDSLYLRVRLGLRVERLPDITPAKAERDAAKAKALLAQLDRVKPEELTHEEELSFDVLRLRLSGLIDEIRRHLETQWTKGVVIPREEIDLVTPFLRALSGDIESSPLGVKPDRLKSLSEAEVSAFRNRVAKTLERKVHPALTNLISYIDGDYRRKAAAAVGLAQYPDGKEYYAWLAKYHTGLNITPEEVHTIGLREVEKINREMDRIQAALGWSRAQAVAFMRENLMETDAQLHTESLRYSCDIPGQALGYRMGFLKFLELREKAQKALGKCFDIRRFHDALLSSGSLPLATLERHIDWFIKGEKQRAGL